MRQKLFSVTLKDCRVDTFTVGGHGGSGKDTSNTGVRVVHLASGAQGECTKSRSQLQNKRDAFVHMAQTQKFHGWARAKAAELASGKTLDERVDEEMCAENLKVEIRGEDGKWTVEPFGVSSPLFTPIGA